MVRRHHVDVVRGRRHPANHEVGDQDGTPPARSRTCWCLSVRRSLMRFPPKAIANARLASSLPEKWSAIVL